MSGEDVQLPIHSLKEIFEFANLGKEDIFYHLGCGNGKGIQIALQEFHVKRAVGIDIDSKKIELAIKLLDEENLQAEIINENILDSKFNDATVILFWFTNPLLIEKMMKKFERLNKGCKIITIWAPLPACLPYKVKFPYIINQIPFNQAKNLPDQLLAIFGVKCIDFVTSWEYAERYTKAIGSPDIKNDRFLTIIQSLMIWINARNLGVACGKEIPEPIKDYIGILRNFFDIDVEYLLKK